MRIYAISTDRPEDGRDLARKIEADHKGPLGFALLSDPHARTIDRYGLRDPAYVGDKKYDGVPHPSVFVLDQQGRVRWEKIESDYRERPTNEDVGAALDSFE